MNSQNTVEIDAPAADVWAVFTDVEHWPDWTASVERVTSLDGPGIAVGHRFEIKQPRLPRLVWEVTEVDPGSGWTWRQRSPGTTTFAIHDVVPMGALRTLVRQRIVHRGPLGVVNGLLTLPLTRRYLRLEAAGLKSRVEHESGADVASS